MTRSCEFGALKSLGLQIKPTRADGNCLFNALSDQIYGHQDNHSEIRQVVVQYMRQHPDIFKPFLSVEGPRRRNPKRKNVVSLPSKINFVAATHDELDATFEDHLEEMAQNGIWGDNMEILAFAHAYNTDVRVYRKETDFDIKSKHDDTVRPFAHIAYHEYHHYSSVRNIEGPMTGPPNIQLPTCKLDPVKVKAVKDVIPHQINDQEILKALDQTNGNIKSAAFKAMNTHYPNSHSSSSPAGISSSPGGTSIERESDPDDEDICPPSKRRSRAPETKKSNQSKSCAHDSGSDYKPGKASQKKAKRPVKKASGARKVNQKKKVGQAKAISSSDRTSSETDYEIGRRDSNTSVSDAVTTEMAKETDEVKEMTDIEEGEIKEPTEIKEIFEIKENSGLKELPKIKAFTESNLSTESQLSPEVKAHVEIKESVEVKEPVDINEPLDNEKPVEIKEPTDPQELIETKKAVDIKNMCEMKEADHIEKIQHDKPTSADCVSEPEGHLSVIESAEEYNKSVNFSSGSEADDEFRPDGNDDGFSDSASESPAPKAKKSSRNQKLKNTARKNGVQKHSGKGSKKFKTSDKYLDETIKTVENDRSPSSTTKVSDMGGGNEY